MRFAFTDDQLAFRDAVRSFLAAECPPEVVRSAWADDAPPWPADVWRKLADMGVLGLAAPEAAGGLGLGPLDLVGVLEETGRAAFPGPVVEHAAVATPLLAAARDDRWMPGAVAGDVVVTAGFAASPFVGWAADADMVLLERDGAVYALEPDALDTVRQATVDRSRRLYRLEWSTSDARLVTDDPVLIADAFDRAVLGAAAQLVGIAARLIEVAVDYAKTRRQFGAPIGSYQAVKHHLANAYLKLDYARPVVYRAAWSMAEGEPERGVHVSMAKAFAGDAAMVASRVALQVHGAIGYASEHDLHLWMKRAWALGAQWGDGAWHRERVASHVLGRIRA